MTSYERVKLSRERTAGVFPLPNVLDCIRFSICELAEMDDALLRIHRNTDKRNNVRVHDPREELGQALYMLLSAAVQLDVEPVFKPLACPGYTNYITAYAFALNKLSVLLGISRLSCVPAGTLQDAFDVAYSALFYAGVLYSWEEFNVIVDETCAAFERKHAAVAE